MTGTPIGIALLALAHEDKIKGLLTHASRFQSQMWAADCAASVYPIVRSKDTWPKDVQRSISSRRIIARKDDQDVSNQVVNTMGWASAISLSGHLRRLGYLAEASAADSAGLFDPGLASAWAARAALHQYGPEARCRELEWQAARLRLWLEGCPAPIDHTNPNLRSLHDVCYPLLRRPLHVD